MTTLFISHRSKQKAWAEEIRDALSSNGYQSLFLDSHPEDGIPAGVDWEQDLWQKLRQSRGLVVLCTADWLRSPWCVAEAMIARERGKKIVMLAAPDVTDDRQVKDSGDGKAAPRLPDFLRKLQFVSLARPTMDEAAFQGLWRGLEAVGLKDTFPRPDRPYPGLLAFQETDAAVFFGRDDKIAELDAALDQRRGNNAKGFLLVLGASGCGKSSVVRAGVLPRLRRAEASGEKAWLVTSPFFGREGLAGLVDRIADAFDADGQPVTASSIRARVVPRRAPTGEADCDTQALNELAREALRAHRLKDAYLVLVVDQLEEVFDTEERSDARAALRLLLDAGADPASRIAVLATMRSDFLNAFQLFEGAAEHDQERFEKITVNPMPKARFAELIEGPADRWGLRLEPGLTEHLVEDTRYDDALPLLAYTLEQLYARAGDDGFLEIAEYRALFPPVEVRAGGKTTTYRGVSAAIKHVADEILKESGYADLAADDPRLRDLRRAFYSLARVGEEGQFTRRPAERSRMPASRAAVLQRFVDKRLLVSDQGMLSVAHEALFRVWDTLRGWLEADRKALALRAQIEDAAAEWQAENRAESRAWPEERILDAVGEIERSGVSLADVNDRATVDAFLGPTDPKQLGDLPALDAADDEPAGNGRYGEAWRLPLGHAARASVGVRLAILGDRRKGVGLRADGLPDIVWRRIDGGAVTIEIRADANDANSKVVKRLTGTVAPFWMARYPVTIVQFRAFLNECHRADGWHLPSGFVVDLPADYPPPKHRARHDNHPADSVNWFDALAFCHWLSARLGFEVRLPTEYEWQLAATGGDPRRTYPWSDPTHPDWDPAKEPWRANTSESELGRSTAVGMYPAGASPAGLLDMAGSLWEWCLDPFETARGGSWLGRLVSKPSVEQTPRVLRGGSWGFSQDVARAAARSWLDPYGRGSSIGFRVVCSSPSSGTES